LVEVILLRHTLCKSHAKIFEIAEILKKTMKKAESFLIFV